MEIQFSDPFYLSWFFQEVRKRKRTKRRKKIIWKGRKDYTKVILVEWLCKRQRLSLFWLSWEENTLKHGRGIGYTSLQVGERRLKYQSSGTSTLWKKKMNKKNKKTPKINKSIITIAMKKKLQLPKIYFPFSQVNIFISKIFSLCYLRWTEMFYDILTLPKSTEKCWLELTFSQLRQSQIIMKNFCSRICLRMILK